MVPARCPRRDFLRAGLLGSLMIGPARAHAIRPLERARFRLKETAGLRRFGYPVSVAVPIPNGQATLLRDGRPVPAQFRVEPEGLGFERRVVLDFNTNIGPGETQIYEIVAGEGEGAPASPKPPGNMGVEVESDHFRVTHGPNLAWEVPRDLSGLFRSIGGPNRDYLHADSTGAWARFADGTVRALGGTGNGPSQNENQVSRSGPTTIGLRFRSVLPGEVISQARLTFPSSKSWAQLDWTITGRRIAAIGLDLHPRITGTTLVDFGASSTVYGTLKAGESMAMVEGPLGGGPRPGQWIITRSDANGPSPFATAAPQGLPRAEGWAHVMDETRCSALALADFGQDARDRIEVAADGRVRIERDYSAGGHPPTDEPATRGLTFWIHVVPMPVQIGALTSPQAMRAPLEVEWAPTAVPD